MAHNAMAAREKDSTMGFAKLNPFVLSFEYENEARTPI